MLENYNVTKQSHESYRINRVKTVPFEFKLKNKRKEKHFFIVFFLVVKLMMLEIG